MDNLAKLKTEIFSKQRILDKIYTQYGGLSLAGYASQWRVSPASKKTKVFFEEARGLLSGMYPKELVDGLLAEALNSPLVSTIDHHGILNHPFFLNSNLIFSQRPNLKYLFCLPTAGVSLNNSSWPGCLLVTGDDGQMRRFSFFPDKIKNQTVLAARPLTAKDANRVLGRIEGSEFLPPERKRLLLNLTKEIFAGPSFVNLNSFTGQASYVSSAIWEKIFPEAPKVVYLPLEALVSRVIIKRVIPDSSHILNKLFFTADGWDIIEKYFSGSLGAFGAGHKGSFLFWGINAGRHRVKLSRLGDVIDGEEELDFKLSGGRLVEALGDGSVYPSSLVCFLVLLYYGVTCLGGFNQVNWLTDIKIKFISLLNELGEGELGTDLANIPTENFAEGSLAFGLNNEGRAYKPTAIDLLLSGEAGLFAKYKRLADHVTVSESIDSQLPEIYRVITPEPARLGIFGDLTEDKIIKLVGLEKKIKSSYLA